MNIFRYNEVLSKITDILIKFFWGYIYRMHYREDRMSTGLQIVL